MDKKKLDPASSPQLALLRRVKAPFALFQHEAAGGLVLFVAAAVALALANSPYAPIYGQLLEVSFPIGVAPLVLEKTLLHWVNDGLMAIFFFLVGLEIKRELSVGALASPKTAALPAIAAVGGMVVPALIYVAINHGDGTALRGWAIPAATDIAFAVGVIALLGSRVPPSLKVFLLALAIIDDLGAIVIIAIFYTDHLSVSALVLAAVCLLALAGLNRRGVTAISPYLLIGLLLWICVLKSGVHATLAGVMTALAIPLTSGGPGRAGPLEATEHALAPWVSFGVLPLFAVANAGVSLAGVGAYDVLQPIPLGIAAGLVFGKPLGIMGFTWLAVRSGAGEFPKGARWAQLFGVALLGGIGFTMSLFIGMLAFPDPAYAAPIRIGVLCGSIVSALLGYLVLRLTCSPERGGQELN